MRRIIGILLIMIVAISVQAQELDLAYASDVNSVRSETGVNMYPSVVTDYLNIDVSDEMSGGTVTVSVFNSIGEIVLEKALGLGLNKLAVEDLSSGQYTAVVRNNGEYKSKMQFEVK